MYVLIHTDSAQATQELAAIMARHSKLGMVFRLDGTLGAGKTTFTQGFGRAMGIQCAVKSPTYTIVKEYDLPEEGQLIHIDAYRLEGVGGDSLDFNELFRPDAITLVEWAEFIEDDLPESYLHIQINRPEELAEAETRRILDISVQGSSAEYLTMIEKLQGDYVRKDADLNEE